MKYTGIRNPRGSDAVESESVTSREVSINEGRPLTTDYDDALEEQRLQALSNDTEKDSLPEESPSFCDRMLPKTRAGRLTLTVISILIVVAICIIAVFLTFGNSNSNSASGSSTGPDYTLIPTSTPILIPTSPPTRGSDSLSPTSNDDRTSPIARTPSSSISTTSPTTLSIPTSFPTSIGTQSPTAQDRDFRYRAVANKLIKEGISNTDDLYPTDGTPTPQTDALSWLLDDDPLNLLANGAATPVARFVQRYIVMTIFFSTGGPGWTKVDNWLTGSDECEWYGLECSNVTIPNVPIIAENTTLADSSNVESHAVISLQLQKNNLVGSLPSEIGFLLECTIIGLYGNLLVGKLPTTVSNIDPLEKLWLDNNKFVGNIPTEYGMFANLNDLSVYANKLSGSIPSEIGGLTRLERFWASGMLLTGHLPTQLGNCHSLMNLYLDANQLSGSMPSELGQLTDMRDMRFFRNQMTGKFPSEIFFSAEPQDCLL